MNVEHLPRQEGLLTVRFLQPTFTIPDAAARAGWQLEPRGV
jgi:hypothetical protein